jgi:ATP-dependent exoDNAse (exonuclease V) alpha subunit
LAIYHHSIKIISRGKGKSAVAAAAYRSGETITNEYDGITHDYTRKGGVAHTEILLPENAPSEYQYRATLWNAVEKSEKNRNAQLAREIEIALPAELTKEQNIALAREYCKAQFVFAGMCADICIHDKSDGNPHAHIMLTLRPMDERGEWAAKSRKEYLTDENGERLRLKNGNYKTRKISTTDWNEQTKAEEWRAAWAQSVNAALAGQGIAERVDHRSYKRQGIEQIPTVHMGVAAAQMERKGIRTERGNKNREIDFTNKQIRQLRARINHLNDWLKTEIENPTPPTLSDIISDILNGGEDKTRYAQIRDLKEAAKVLNFLMSNNISTLPELREKASDCKAIR